MRRAKHSPKGVERSLRGLAVRGIEAEERFLRYAKERAGLSQSEAERVMAAYRKAKVIRFDHVTGQFTVKHGAFLDVETLRHVAETTR